MRNVDCKKGLFIVDPKGRVGMISGRHGLVEPIVCQFGASGPFTEFSHHAIRPATRAEVHALGLDGVGGGRYHDA